MILLSLFARANSDVHDVNKNLNLKSCEKFLNCKTSRGEKILMGNGTHKKTSHGIICLRIYWGNGEVISVAGFS